MDKTKIAVLYIGTGRYTIFWDDFYKSCEENFIKEAEKHYFFFTDSQDFSSNEKVTIIPQENLGWPLIACLRYKILNKVREQLKNYDYAFFFNGNMEFIHEISAKEFLPAEKDGFIDITPHPMNKYIKNNYEFPFERNPNSKAYIPYGEGKVYYQSCLWGGRLNEFLDILDTCGNMIDEDLQNNIIPKFHDESIFNKYVLSRKFKELDLNYIYPTHGKFLYRLNPKIKIIQRDKAAFKYGGHAYLRGESNKKINLFDYSKYKIENLFKKEKKLLK